MSTSKNPYIILELNEKDDPSKEDIKKAYRKLILKYHPDKNTHIDTTDKFKEIQTAYEILYNEDKKKKYDSLNFYDKINYYNAFKSLIIKKYPYINNYLEFIIKNFYDDNELELKKDLENFKIDSIYEHFITHMPKVFNNYAPIQKSFVVNINIEGNIKSTLIDRYVGKYQKLLIERETKDKIEIFVPLIKNLFILNEEGEIGINNINGNIIINIQVPQQYKNFTQIDNDLYLELDVDLYTYLYGGVIQFTNLDDEIINHDVGSLLDNNIIVIDNKGFLIDTESNQRGNMYIICKIKNYELIRNKIKCEFSN